MSPVDDLDDLWPTCGRSRSRMLDESFSWLPDLSFSFSFSSFEELLTFSFSFLPLLLDLRPLRFSEDADEPVSSWSMPTTSSSSLPLRRPDEDGAFRLSIEWLWPCRDEDVSASARSLLVMSGSFKLSAGGGIDGGAAPLAPVGLMLMPMPTSDLVSVERRGGGGACGIGAHEEYGAGAGAGSRSNTTIGGAALPIDSECVLLFCSFASPLLDALERRADAGLPPWLLSGSDREVGTPPPPCAFDDSSCEPVRISDADERGSCRRRLLYTWPIGAGAGGGGRERMNERCLCNGCSLSAWKCCMCVGLVVVLLGNAAVGNPYLQLLAVGGAGAGAGAVGSCALATAGRSVARSVPGGDVGWSMQRLLMSDTELSRS